MFFSTSRVPDTSFNTLAGEAWAGQFVRRKNHMEAGMIELGRMGSNMVRCLLKAGHHCVVYDMHAEAVQALAGDGAVGTMSLDDFADRMLSALRYEFGGHQEKPGSREGGA